MKLIDDEKFLKSKGWIKEKGYKIDLEAMRDYPNDWSLLFIRKVDLNDFLIEIEYWSDGEERASEDTDEIIETNYDEYLDEDGNLYDEPVQDTQIPNHKNEVDK